MTVTFEAIWSHIFTRVRDPPRPTHAMDGSSRFNYHQMQLEREVDMSDEQYFQSLQRRSEEDIKSKQETITLLVRLFSYMAKEWFYYSICFSFLLLYSISGSIFISTLSQHSQSNQLQLAYSSPITPGRWWARCSARAPATRSSTPRWA